MFLLILTRIIVIFLSWNNSEYLYKSRHCKSSYISENNIRKINSNINDIIIENINKKIFLDLFSKNTIDKFNSLINKITDLS